MLRRNSRHRWLLTVTFSSLSTDCLPFFKEIYLDKYGIKKKRITNFYTCEGKNRGRRKKNEAKWALGSLGEVEISQV